jgi:hypothetical protein
MALTVPDVNNIVLANIGGMPQIPATTTTVEGRTVTPQISTLCALGQAIAHLWDAIKSALNAFMNGIDNLILNPLKAFATACLNAINAVLAKINALLSAASAALRAALQAVINAFTAAINAIANIISHIGRLLGEKLQQLLASLTQCAPPQVGAKTYNKSDLASSLDQKQPIIDIQTKSDLINTILDDTNTSDDEKIALLNSASGTITTNSSTLDAAVAHDEANLAESQLQAQGIGKMTTLANALNNPVTADFATSIINPASSDMISGLATVMNTKPVVFV